MMATFEAKVPDQALSPLFSSIAGLFAQAEHALYVDQYVRGRPVTECKQEYLREFGLTARQFNAAAANLVAQFVLAKLDGTVNA